MYRPPSFAEDDEDVVAAMVGRAGMAVLVGKGADGFFATHLPLRWDRTRGVLEGHMAAANPHPGLVGHEALAIFAGPHGYVSPGFYPSKAEHGRQVPTWNYEAVHVHGRADWYDDPARLRGQLERLTEAHEAGRAAPWRMSDAPADYTARLLRGIVGVEITVERVEAKRKLSQNKGARDRAGVIGGLRAEGRHDLAGLMADLETPSE